MVEGPGGRIHRAAGQEAATEEMLLPSRQAKSALFSPQASLHLVHSGKVLPAVERLSSEN